MEITTKTSLISSVWHNVSCTRRTRLGRGVKAGGFVQVTPPNKHTVPPPRQCRARSSSNTFIIVAYFIRPYLSWRRCLVLGEHLQNTDTNNLFPSCNTARTHTHWMGMLTDESSSPYGTKLNNIFYSLPTKYHLSHTQSLYSEPSEMNRNVFIYN